MILIKSQSTVQVQVKFLSTWKGGRDYTWESPNWCHSPEKSKSVDDGPQNEIENIPGSQDIVETPRAECGSVADKKLLKKRCARCYQGKKNQVFKCT